MGELGDRLREIDGSRKDEPEAKRGKPSPLEVELGKIEEDTAKEIKLGRAQNALLDQQLQIKDKQARLKSVIREDTEKEARKFSVIEGQVILDPDGKLTLHEALAMAADQRAATSPQKPFMQGIDEILEGGLTKRLANLIAGESEGGIKKLAEDIKSIDELKETLGVPKRGSITDHLANGSVRTDLARLMLEDERERIRIDKEHEVEMAKVKAEDGESNISQPLVEEIAGALRETAQHYTGKTTKRKTATKNKGKTLVSACPHCGERLTFKKKPTGEIECPKCHGVMRAA